MTKHEFIKKAIENGLQSGYKHVWCTVNGVKCIIEHHISHILKENPDHELWDALFEQYKENIKRL